MACERFDVIVYQAQHALPRHEQPPFAGVPSAEVAIPAGRLVTVTVVNHGSKPHRFGMQDFDASVSLAPGEETTLSIVASPDGHAYSVEDVSIGNPTATGRFLWARDATATTPVATP